MTAPTVAEVMALANAYGVAEACDGRSDCNETSATRKAHAALESAILALHARVEELEKALRELVTAHDDLQQRSWPGGPADYEQQRDRLRKAWATAHAALNQTGEPKA